MSGLFGGDEQPATKKVVRPKPIADPEGTKATSRKAGAKRRGARTGTIHSALTGDEKLGG